MSEHQPAQPDIAAMSRAEGKIERLETALAEIERLRLATNEGTLAKRADRMWEIACEALGRPVPGTARPVAEVKKERPRPPMYLPGGMYPPGGGDDDSYLD